MHTNQTKKRNLWLVILILIVIAFGLIIFLINRGQKGSGGEDSTSNPFPFGERVLLPDPDAPTRSIDFIDPNGPAQLLSRKRFRQITDFPISGFRSYNTNGEILSQESISIYNEKGGDVAKEDLETITTPRVQYIKQDSGFVIQTLLGEELQRKTLASTLIPNSVESFFSSTGKGVLYRYLNEQTRRTQAFLAKIDDTSAEPYTCPYIPDKIMSLGDKDGQIIVIKNAINALFDKPVIFANNNEFNQELSNIFLSLQKEANMVDPTGELNEQSLEIIKNICNKLAEEFLKFDKDQEQIKELTSGSFLEQDISFTSHNSSSDKIFYIRPEILATTFGKIISFDSTSPETILETPFSEWIPQWVNDDLITLTTAASGLAEGYVFTLDTASRKMTKIIGPKYGLTSLMDPTGQFVLYSETSSNGKSLETKIYNKSTAQSFSLPVRTFPEKCIWSNNSLALFCASPKEISKEIQPDTWYKGLSNLDDKLWRIDLIDNSATAPVKLSFLLDPQLETGYSMDIVKPHLSPDETFLFFVDQNTNELWSLEIDGLNDSITANFAL